MFVPLILNKQLAFPCSHDYHHYSSPSSFHRLPPTHLSTLPPTLYLLVEKQQEKRTNKVRALNILLFEFVLLICSFNLFFSKISQCSCIGEFYSVIFSIIFHFIFSLFTLFDYRKTKEDNYKIIIIIIIIINKEILEYPIL